ncbi:TIR domain-containing protein [Bradyrhizobium sp. IC3123]|uniref:toll/interleukin-1 receptor domain-containing protein n=1 Tax=Bradyrhizobium sp. IC3123 TaxID=2793803 RepID=UPI001CD72694|nr:TIR domain-containing protein [Bradyrhizobium sp. IC3123]MCA1392044.1 TIR domain-containing protein [Bradyrhizobium sp. IC3123]
MAENRHYDIALSFAGEDRAYVDRVANLLKDRGVKVFYDLFEQADLWGKDLYVHLSEVYHKRARFTVMFISEAYAKKLWTNHERKSAQARAFQDAQEYILPVRFDETEIPGVLSTVGYISLKERSPEDLVSLITKKLVSSGGSLPTELVRRDFSTLARAEPLPGNKFAVVVRDDEGMPIKGCELTVQAENGTFNSAITGDDGVAVFEPKVRRPSTLLASHPRFPAAIFERVDPDGAMQISIPRTDNIGSITMCRTGHIPGLRGRLNPKLDSSERTYLYADNIAIDGGKRQPVAFNVNVPFELEDADGAIVYATIKHIAGDISLVQYTRKPEA